MDFNRGMSQEVLHNSLRDGLWPQHWLLRFGLSAGSSTTAIFALDNPFAWTQDRSNSVSKLSFLTSSY